MEGFWDESHEKMLAQYERTMETLGVLVKNMNTWCNMVSDNMQPSDVNDELVGRITHAMWSVAMMKPILNSSSPGEAFSKLARWISEMGPDTGVHIEEIDATSDELKLAQARRRAREHLGLDPDDDRGYL